MACVATILAATFQKKETQFDLDPKCIGLAGVPPSWFLPRNCRFAAETSYTENGGGGGARAQRPAEITLLIITNEARRLSRTMVC